MEENNIAPNNTMVVTDDKGNEHLLKILFTYENEERGKKYVFFYEEDDEDNILVMSYTEDGELYDVEDEEEYSEVEEVFNAYNEDPQIEELKK